MNYGWEYTKNILDGHVVNYLARDAIALADGNLTAIDSVSGLSLDKSLARNALAHAQVSSEWAWNYGRAVATKVGNYKEGGIAMADINISTNAGKDAYKDQYNNEVGRRITEWAKANSLTQDQTDKLLLDAFKDGHLVVELNDPRVLNKDLPTWSAPSGSWETAANGRDYSGVDDFSEDPIGFADKVSNYMFIGLTPVPAPGYVLEISIAVAAAIDAISPLVFDLDDSGTIELKSLANSTTYWDIDVDGFAEHSGWVTGGDGLLAIDLNEDGIINNNAELFGNMSGYANGFATLASYDSNHDGLITAADSVYSDLLMWVDAANDNEKFSELLTPRCRIAA